jgi:Dyp-type peroxidase family
VLRRDLGAYEHFGFRDGVSQPVIGNPRPTRQAIAAGEFILGYPKERGIEPLQEPRWAHNGSYAVFRRLRQDVWAFRQSMKAEANRSGVKLSEDELAVKLVGRSRDGVRLSGSVPRCAHIHKARPTDTDKHRVRTHRLIRRGITYGPPLPEGASEDDGQDRGMLFLAFQSSLRKQFEHIHRAWLDDPDFPHPGVGPDPLVGQRVGSRQVMVPQKGGGVQIELAQFVTMTGGGYFFAPSIAALKYLANPAAGYQD